MEGVAMRGRIACAVLVMAALFFTAAGAQAKVISTAGSGPGQTLNPTGLAVDFETGRLYVADTGNERIDVFSGSGTFVKSFAATGTAIAVDNDPASSSQHDLYVVDSDNSTITKFGPEGEFKLSFGAPGEGEGEFSNAGRVLVGVGPNGTVYVVDSLKDGAEFKHRLQKFTPAGVLIAPQHILAEGEGFPVVSLAVGSGSGNLYVTIGDAQIRKYDASGNFISEIIDVFEGAPFIKSVIALGISSEENLFAVSSGLGDEVSTIEFDPTGGRLRRFGYGALDRDATAIAPTPKPESEGVYISEGPGDNPEGNRVVQIGLPPAGPLVFPAPCKASPLGASTATLRAEINPEGKATSYRFQYVDQESFEDEGFANPQEASGAAALPADFKLHPASAALANLVPETEYHCRVVASNADAPAGNEGPEGTFKTLLAPEIIDIRTFGVGENTATLEAEVNPLGTANTTGYFEYVDEAGFQASGFEAALKAPVGPALSFGGGETPVVQSTLVSGLSPGTTYHYRFVGTNGLIAPKEIDGEAETFRTFASGQQPLADGRGWELVSPAQKNSAEVAVPGVRSGLVNREHMSPISAAAGSGEAITYTSWTSFGDPAGAHADSQYLSRRTATGWSTANISPFGVFQHPLDLAYRGFSADLRFGGVVTSEPPLTAEAQAGIENLYLRDNQSGALQALTIEAPELALGEGFCADYAGASADGSRAIFAGKGAMTGTGALAGSGFSLYEWSAGGGLALVSVLPGGAPAPPDPKSGFGAAAFNCTVAQKPIRNAISADGSVIFWTYGGEYEGAKEPLFVRVDATETVQVDGKPAEKPGAEKPGAGPYGGGKFWAANSAGTMAVFVAPGLLTKGAKAKNQLYRFNTADHTLADLTPGKVDPEIEGVIGASEDGNYVYFVGRGDLSAEEENATGQKALQGANNLYLSHAGAVRFIGRLSALDEGDWSRAPETLSARVSPDGRTLAFLTVESQALSQYDNTIATGSHCQPNTSLVESGLVGDPHCPEAYLYDADANALTCASCSPAGSRPLGPARLPGWSNPFEGPRYLSDDGSRLFFESRDVLSAADRNERRDVYEFEREGSGTCSAESPDFLPSSGACLSLVSDGRSSDESYLLDASASGRDVFFSTRSVLSGWDTNETYDVYDAREGGGFPEPPTPGSPCEGEGCRPPASPPPPPATPATPTFTGPGNPKQHKHKGHKKKHKHKGHKHKQAGHKGRGRR
jgi:hypothetical protein